MRARSTLAGLLLLAGVVPASQVDGAELPRSARKWVRTTLGSLSVDQKAAQMVMVRAYGRFANPRSEARRELVEQVGSMGVGGVVVFDSDLESIPRLLDSLQGAAEIPLLVASDLERGVAFRVRRGSVSLPSAMAIGATRSEAAAEFAGEVTAREGRALGIHWAFAPVLDVNNNPANPVINLRSFGEDPQWVARLGAAFVRGARRGGMLTTAKHFPGHGDTAVDSHVELPTLSADRTRLQAIELPPFQRAIEAGVDSVMLGHIAVPAIDPTGVPATLSRAVVGGLLRRDLGFEGLIVTDAMEMAGVAGVWSGAAAVRAVQAGADVILLPPDPRVAIASLARAVREGQLDEARLDASVRRILEAKAGLGLHRDRLAGRADLNRKVARPEDVQRALDAASASTTLLRNVGDVLPLRAEEPLRVLHIVIGADPRRPYPGSVVSRELRGRWIETVTRRLGREVAGETEAEILASATGFSHVLVSAFVPVPPSPEDPTLAPSQGRLLRRLARTGVPVVLASFGSPYLVSEIPEVPVSLCAYGAAVSSQRALVSALLGEKPIGGRLPVSFPATGSGVDTYAAGHGLELEPRAMTLEAVSPAGAGFDPERWREVERVVEGFVEQRAFPGAVLAVGHRGKLVGPRSFGRLSYDDNAPPTAADTIYDLASLTKVIATTTMAMILVDEGRLDLDAPVRDFLPRFTGPGKEKVTIRHLLTHSSGVDWWAPLYEELRGQPAYVERIQAMDLVYEPGTETKYSDLGLILMGEILERASGRPLDAFVHERVFEPLGMADTLFRPGAGILARVAPTEHDAWRGRMVRGEVHDENAFALGGVAPHAGLFSNAGDLARFARMIQNGGVLEHRRIVSRPTVESFTRRAGIVPDSTRALGWDTKSAEGSSAGTLFSADSFGHTGFTGTSIWLDPQRDLFVILLTNRVHPTRENKMIRRVRPAVADAVVRALAEPTATETRPEPAISVRVGLDRLDSEEASVLRDRRLGLIVHAASLAADGRHAIDVVSETGLEVARLFAPEHGLRGRAAAGEHVEDGVDPKSGLPVVSLYGGKRAPAAEDLEGLDALVFDLQGAGVRFYTYVSTLILALQAAAENELEFVVLDRPNPLGGERVEGPVSGPRSEVPESFVNLAPGPLMHGLTLGEMARYVNARLDKPARLTVVPMGGWERGMTWADTGRPWVSPSPNLRSAEAAIAYPGVALLEATNVNEGRGTKEPFLYFGAPWLNSEAVEVHAPGFVLEPARFTPRASAAAPRPKYLDRECAGFRVRVVDPARAEPYRLGLELVTALARQPGFEWRRGGEALTWLLGTNRVYRDLASGKSADDILNADRADHESWRTERRPALLYRP